MSTETLARVRGETQTLKADDVLAMLAWVRHGTWLADIYRTEMAQRGLDHLGEWVGFPRAREIWQVGA